MSVKQSFDILGNNNQLSCAYGYHHQLFSLAQHNYWTRVKAASMALSKGSKNLHTSNSKAHQLTFYNLLYLWAEPGVLLLPVSYKMYKHNWCKSSSSNPLKYLNASQKWTCEKRRRQLEISLICSSYQTSQCLCHVSGQIQRADTQTAVS